MSYCVNPACAEPTSAADDARICPSCNASLILRERYRSLRLLGQGGFGRTFLAVDESKGSKLRCVVKQLFPQQQNERQRASRMFRQEAQRLRSLEAHSQIPDLIDYFELDEQQYLVQEFIDGQDLAVVLNSGKTSSPEAIVELLRSLLPVLQFMHEHQVIHRDIKPANIIRRDRDQQLFLVDLGAAKVATGTALARTGTTIGSAEYTAPEQLRGKAVFASDIYSLGMTCLHLLTGVSPFNLYNADEGRLAWQDYLRAPVDQRLSRILAGMTAVATRLRYGSAKDVLWELRDFSGVRTAPGARAATQPSVSSSSASSKTFVPVPRPSMRPELQQPPVFKPFSPIEPVQLPLAESDEPHPLISQRQETAIATRAASSEPKDLLWSEEPSTLAELAVNVLAGERPLSALGERLKRDFSSREAIRASIKSEFPDWATGDLAWVFGRTALTLLLMLGVPGLLAFGFYRLQSTPGVTTNRPKPPSLPISNAVATSPNPHYPSYAYDELLWKDEKLVQELVEMYGVYPPPPATVNAVDQAPNQGTTRLSETTPLKSISTEKLYPARLEVSESGNALLVNTTSSTDTSVLQSMAVEVLDLRTFQWLKTLPIESKYVPQIIFSGNRDELFIQAYPESFPSEIKPPEIIAWNWRTGSRSSVLPFTNDFFLGAVGPQLESGEFSIIGHSASGDLIVFSSKTGHITTLEKFFGGPSLLPHYKSFIAAGNGPRNGQHEIIVKIFNINSPSKKSSFDILPSLFSRDDEKPPSITSWIDVNLKFNSRGDLYIGREALSCLFSCLEIYDFSQGEPSRRHVPAQIPPFYELFFGPRSDQIVLYIPGYLGGDAQLQVWNIKTGTLIKRILLEEPYTLSDSDVGVSQRALPIKLSADGSQLYTAHLGEIKIWDFQALLEQE